MDFVFDLLFASMAVFNTFGMLLIGVVFSAIGGGMVFADIYTRGRSKKVKAKIIGLEISERKTGNMYYPVFRYKNLQGETVENKASWDSNTLLNNLPGRTATLLLRNETTETIHQNTRMFTYVGLFFLLPGLFIFGEGLKTVEFKTSYLLVVAVGILYLAYRVYQFFAKIGWSNIKAEFQKSRATGKPWFIVNETQDRSIKENGFTSRLMTVTEIERAIPKEKKRFARISMFLILAAAIALFFAHRTGMDVLKLQTQGDRAQGTIVDFNTSYGDDSTTYTAVFEFKTAQGIVVRKKDSFGSSHPTLKRREVVQVLYDPRKPDHAIIDRGLWNWFMSGLLSLLGLIFVMLAVGLLRLVAESSAYRARL